MELVILVILLALLLAYVLDMLGVQARERQARRHAMLAEAIEQAERIYERRADHG